MSSSRIQPLTPDALNDDQRELYEQIVGGPRGDGVIKIRDAKGTLTGPFGLMLLAPSVGKVLSSLGEAIRYQSSLDDRVREIAILTVAIHRRASFEWYAHEAVARHMGMTDDELLAIRDGDTARWTAPIERAAHRAALELVRERTLSEPFYTQAREALGVSGLAQLTMLVGYYDTIALLMSAFEVGLPDGERDPFS